MAAVTRGYILVTKAVMVVTKVQSGGFVDCDNTDGEGGNQTEP